MGFGAEGLPRPQTLNPPGIPSEDLEALISAPILARGPLRVYGDRRSKNALGSRTIS